MEYLLGLEGGIREFSPWAVTRLARALDIDAPPVGAGFEEIEESTADVRQRIIDCARESSSHSRKYLDRKSTRLNSSHT